jgi:flagellin-like protein
LSEDENMSRRLCADKRGISPVVATVILVAVTIVVAVAVAYWMGGIAGLYTRYEKIEFVGAYAEYDATGTKWTITITVKNTGSADATIDNILLNGKPYSQINDATVTAKYDSTDLATTPLSLKVGAEDDIVITITPGSDSTFKSGVSVEVRLHSAAGQEYPKTVALP